MTETNIWDSIEFNIDNSKSVYDILSDQNKYLEASTESELKMQIETTNGILDDKSQRWVKINKLYVVAPKLGGFRKKILSVAEGIVGSKFPVDIFCHIDEKQEKNVPENEFLNKIHEILSRQPVKFAILDLFQRSKDLS